MCDVWSPEEHIHVHTYQLFAVVNGAKCDFSLSLDGYSVWSLTAVMLVYYIDTIYTNDSNYYIIYTYRY